MKTIKLVLVILFSIAVGACGKSSDNPAPATYSLSGTAAQGAAIASANVTIKDKNGSTQTVTTGTDGKYTIDVTGKTPPFLLKVPAGTGYLYSVATATGTANIHPFTDLIIRNWYKVQGSNVETDFSGTNPLVTVPTATEINTIEAVIRSILSSNLTNVGVTASNFNLLTSSFDADHTGFDKVLDNTKVAVSTTDAVTVTATDPTTGITGTMVSTNLTTNLTTADSTAPTDPTGLSAIPASATSIVLVWNASTDNVGVAGYNIYRDATKVGTSSYPVYSDAALTSSTAYCYQVEALDGAGNVSVKSPATAVCATTLAAPDTTAPSAPTSLTATTVSASRIDLSWTASTSTDVAGYAIYRGTIKVAAVSGTSYSDTALSSGTAYSYTVKAMDGALNLSAASNTASATTQAGIPAVPTGVSATAGDGQVTISWNAVSGATSYILYMATQSGVTKNNYSTLTGGMTHPGVTSPYAHTGLANGTTYYFIVTAVNASGESVESAQVSATPAAATASNYAGTYSGTLTVNSVSSGTFSVTVDSAGAMNGSVFFSSATPTVTGTVTSGGIVSFMLSGKTDTYSGTINAATGAFSAVCTGGCVDNPVFTGVKRLTVSAAIPIANTSTHEVSSGAAFDGTNFLVGIADKPMPDLTNANQSITAQLISKTGALVGPRIITGAIGGGSMIAFDGMNYLLVYEEITTNTVAGQFVSASGGLVGLPFNIVTSPNRKLGFPSGFLFDGMNYFVVWESEGTAGNGDTADIFGQFITPGGAKLGSVVSISTGVHGQRMPAIAFDGMNILAVWADGRSQSACDSTGSCYESDIYGQFISKSGASAGALLGGNFLISAGTLPCDNPVSIAFDGTNYLVTFVEETTFPNACPVAGCNWETYGILVPKAGAPTGSRFVIGSPTTGAKMLPLPVYLGTQYLVTWSDGMGTPSASVKGQYVTTSGTVSGTEFTLSSPAASGALPYLGVVVNGGGVNLAITNWGIPDAADPSNMDLTTSADVMGSIITIP